MSRRIPALGLGLTLILSSCSMARISSTETASLQLTDTYTEEALAMFTKGDSFDTLIGSSPYYLGVPTPGIEAFTAFRKAKEAKIQEAVTLTDELISATTDVEKALRPFQDALTAYIAAALPVQHELESFARGVAQERAGTHLREQGLLAVVSALGNAPRDATLAGSMLEYERTVAAIQLADATSEDLAQLLSACTQLSLALEDTDDATIRAARTTFEEQMERVRELNDRVTKMVKDTITLDVALRQLALADIRVGKASLERTRADLPAIKEELARLVVSPNVDQETIDFLRGYVDLFDTTTTKLATMLSAVDEKSILALAPARPPFLARVPIAHADTLGAMSEAWTFLSTKAGDVAVSAYNVSSAASTLTWNGLKTGFHAAKIGTGVALDTISAVDKMGIDVAMGMYYGNSVIDVASTIGDNFAQVKKNYDAGNPGAMILSTGEGYMNGVEEGAQQFVEGGIANTIGEGWTSWGAGHIAKLTAGMFTGFAKGVYKIANTESSNGQVAEGMLDVGLSFIGGSKVLFKGSQVLTGGSEGLSALGSKGLTYLRLAATRWEKEELKTASKELLKKGALNSDDVIRLVSNALEIEGKEVLEGALKQVSKDVDKRFLDLLKDGSKTLYANATDGVATSYKEFAKQAFEHSLAGYRDALTKVLGESAKDFIDNLIAAKADDLIKGYVKGEIDGVPIPGMVVYDGVYSGQWVETGATLPVTATVEDAAFSTIVPFAMGQATVSVSGSMTFAGTIDAEGNVTGTVKGGGTISGPATGSSTTSGTFTGTCDGLSLSIEYSVKSTTSMAAGPGFPGGTFGSSTDGGFTLYRKDVSRF